MNIQKTKNYVLRIITNDDGTDNVIDVKIPTNITGYKKLNIVSDKFEQKLGDRDSCQVVVFGETEENIIYNQLKYELDKNSVLKTEYKETNVYCVNHNSEFFDILKKDVRDLISYERLWEQIFTDEIKTQ